MFNFKRKSFIKNLYIYASEKRFRDLVDAIIFTCKKAHIEYEQAQKSFKTDWVKATFKL